jgi:hypothetical protein
MVRIVSDLADDWRQLDDRIETVTDEIETPRLKDAAIFFLIHRTTTDVPQLPVSSRSPVAFWTDSSRCVCATLLDNEKK